MSTNDSKANETAASTSSSNFTPLNPQELGAKKTHEKINFILLTVALVTLLVIGLILFSLLASS